jgi:hypothetical protein
VSDLLPKLKRVLVDPKKLYLDPNNPRFVTRDTDRRDESTFLDQDVITQTRDKMLGKLGAGSKDKDEYRINEITDSIITNGWNPVDSIFVRKFREDEERYVVLEGNRRVTAIQSLLEDKTTPDDVKDVLKEIEVMEIVDKVATGSKKDKSLKEIEKKVSYLLGVRHHGSLKKWSPYAQSARIFDKYLRNTGQSEDTFLWCEKSAREIAKGLTMQVPLVKERLQTYRAMTQISKHKKVADCVNGAGVKDHHYSLVTEVLQSRQTVLRVYIEQNPSTFLLTDLALERIINLCHFDIINRAGAPINNPQQWRFLARLLDNDNTQQRENYLYRVEVDKHRPEDIYAEWVKLATIPKWDSWLESVSLLFKDLPFRQFDAGNPEHKEVVSSLGNLLDELSKRDRSA